MNATPARKRGTAPAKTAAEPAADSRGNPQDAFGQTAATNSRSSDARLSRDDRRLISSMMRMEPWLESARDYARIERVVFRVAVIGEALLSEEENERLDRLGALINAYDAGCESRQSTKRHVARLSPAELAALVRRAVTARTKREVATLTRRIVGGFYGR